MRILKPQHEENLFTVTRDGRHSEERVRVGWREWVALPGLGLPAVKAKIDTGARTSALHIFRVETFRRRGRDRVRFWVHPLQRRRDIEACCEADILDERIVCDSGGHRERRIVIWTLLQLGTEEWPVEITLANRDSMMFRMLLGRTALPKHFVVDPGNSFLAGRALAKAYKKQTPRQTPKGME